MDTKDSIVPPLLPSYHDMLDYLVTELGVPGSPTFYEAVAWIKAQLPVHARKCGACSNGRHDDCSGWCFCPEKACEEQ